MKDLVIVGTGGWGRGVHNILEAINQDTPTWNFLGFLEDDIKVHGYEVHGCPVLGGTDWLERHPNVSVVIGIGNSAQRKKMARQLCALAGVRFATLIHPSAWIGKRVSIGEGTVVHANCVITIDLRVGRHVLLNIASSLTHDDEIEDYVTVQPGVNISGAVCVGEGTEIGTGSNIIQGVQIGAWSVIGAGATVISDIPGNVTAVGTPAKTIKQHAEGWQVQ